MDTVPLIVIPDTQGQYSMFMWLVDELERLGFLDGRIIGLLGDMFDRGEDPKKLMDAVVSLSLMQKLLGIRGNHEDVFIKLLSVLHWKDETSREVRDAWLDVWLGSGAFRSYESVTLESYSINRDSQSRLQTAELFYEALMESNHWDFLLSLPYYLEHGDMILVHAGIKENVPWREQRNQLDEDILGMDSEPEQTYSHVLGRRVSHNELGKCVVSGHTPRAKPFISPSRVMLDCGAGRKDRPLIAWVSDTNQVVGVRPDGSRFVTNPD